MSGQFNERALVGNVPLHATGARTQGCAPGPDNVPMQVTAGVALRAWITLLGPCSPNSVIFQAF